MFARFVTLVLPLGLAACGPVAPAAMYGDDGSGDGTGEPGDPDDPGGAVEPTPDLGEDEPPPPQDDGDRAMALAVNGNGVVHLFGVSQLENYDYVKCQAWVRVVEAAGVLGEGAMLADGCVAQAVFDGDHAYLGMRILGNESEWASLHRYDAGWVEAADAWPIDLTKSGPQPWSVTLTGEGDVLAVGRGPDGARLASHGPNGVERFNVSLGTSDAFSVVAAPGGQIYVGAVQVSGVFEPAFIGFDANGLEQWRRELPFDGIASAMAIAPEGPHWFLAQKQDPELPLAYWLGRYDEETSGWSLDSEIDGGSPASAATDAAGNLFVAGELDEAIDGVFGHWTVRKFDPTGALQWTTSLGHPRTNYSNGSMAMGPEGSLYTIHHNELGGDSLSRVLPSGTVQWTIPVLAP